jgi:hypothetical protein
MWTLKPYVALVFSMRLKSRHRKNMHPNLGGDQTYDLMHYMELQLVKVVVVVAAALVVVVVVVVNAQTLGGIPFAF